MGVPTTTDPNALLDELLRLSARIKALAQHPEHDPDPDDVARLCETVRSLDEWLRREGLLPARWARPVPPPREEWDEVARLSLSLVEQPNAQDTARTHVLLRRALRQIGYRGGEQ